MYDRSKNAVPLACPSAKLHNEKNTILSPTERIMINGIYDIREKSIAVIYIEHSSCNYRLVNSNNVYKHQR